MKKLLLIGLTTVITLCGWAQTADYEVFSLSGEVHTLFEGEWKPLIKLAPLTTTSRLRVGDSSSITIREKKSGALYPYAVPGEIKLGIMLSEERKRKDGLIRHVNAYTVEQLKNNSDQNNRNHMAVIGGTSRGRQMEELSDSIYCTLRYVLSLHAQGHDIAYGQVTVSQIEQQSGKPISSRQAGREMPYYFRISNHSDSPLCVNILRIKSGTTSELCFDLGYTYDEPYLLIMAGQTIDVDQYLFADQGQASSYVLFASPHTFDTRQIKQLLARNAPADPNCRIPLFFAVITNR